MPHKLRGSSPGADAPYMMRMPLGSPASLMTMWSLTELSAERSMAAAPMGGRMFCHRATLLVLLIAGLNLARRGVMG